MTTTLLKTCILIPAYMESTRIKPVIEETLDYCPNVIVIDDGSADETDLVAAVAGAIVLEHVHNQGKGVALQTGFDYAKKHGYDLAITLDADGQHAPSDIPAFLKAYARTQSPCFVGNRMDDIATMPRMRRFVNRTMSNLLSRVMGQYVPDTQCGYRLYHKSVFPTGPYDPTTRRFAAESEILLRLSLQGKKIGTVPIQTIYGDEKSKINPVTDTFRFFRMVHRFKKIKRKALSQ